VCISVQKIQSQIETPSTSTHTRDSMRQGDDYEEFQLIITTIFKKISRIIFKVFNVVFITYDRSQCGHLTTWMHELHNDVN
jgi:hypothetical protein